jgi:adenosylcobinamide-GDP ribazoletransferase
MTTKPDAWQAWGPWFAARADELAVSIAFLSRLRFVREAPIAGAGLAQAVWAFPIAGLLVGVIGAVVYGLAHRIGLPPWPAAALSVAATLAATGCLHEDGLADTADGFGCGATPERKLEIMRDSRIGAYGAIALTLSLILRLSALSAALSHGLSSAAGALVIVGAVSRAGALAPLALLGPARADGAGATAGRLEPASFAAACGAALVVALLLGLLTVGAGHAIDAALAGALGAAAMTALAYRQIGGQTGDVAGAAQQWAEVAGWCGLLMGRFAA